MIYQSTSEISFKGKCNIEKVGKIERKQEIFAIVYSSDEFISLLRASCATCAFILHELFWTQSREEDENEMHFYGSAWKAQESDLRRLHHFRPFESKKYTLCNLSTDPLRLEWSLNAQIRQATDIWYTRHKRLVDRSAFAFQQHGVSNDFSYH